MGRHPGRVTNGETGRLKGWIDIQNGHTEGQTDSRDRRRKGWTKEWLRDTQTD